MIRTAIIGLGNRGRATLRRYMVLEGLEIVALADLNQANLSSALEIITQEKGRCDAMTCSSPYGWKQMAEREDIDLIVICTDWQSHTPIATYAMRKGRHVAVEVPAATTLDECRLLVSTAQETGCHCLMMENCCYDPFHLGSLEIVRQGLIGEVTHCEGAYIHDLSQEIQAGTYHDAWMPRYVASHGGNPYPTHGLGPACQIMDIGGSDSLVSLYSASTKTGGLNHTIINTRLGRTIMLDYDITTPRPYSRRQTVCGTLGFIEKYPTPTLYIDGHSYTGQDAIDAVFGHIPQHYRKIMEDGQRLKVPNMMNYIMDASMTQALETGRCPDIAVKDAALWSAIAPLTAKSSETGLPVEIPSF